MTRGNVVKDIVDKFFQTFPTPQQLLDCADEELAQFIKPLGKVTTAFFVLTYAGLWRKRVQSLKTFTWEFIHNNWTYPIELHGIGKIPTLMTSKANMPTIATGFSAVMK